MVVGSDGSWCPRRLVPIESRLTLPLPYPPLPLPPSPRPHVGSYHCATLYFTGSDELNKMMRQVAIDKGVKLSEYAIVRMEGNKEAGAPEQITCEQDVFELLGMPYKPPTDRNV